MTRPTTAKRKRIIRRANAPYLKIDIAGRLVLNAYRTADRRVPGVDPVAQRITEDGRFDVTRGVMLRFGQVGVFAAMRRNGPALRRAA